MLIQVLVFSAAVVLVFAGLIGAIVKFTLTGKVDTKLSERVNLEQYNEAMRQSGLKEQKTESTHSQRDTAQQMTISHSMS